MGGSASVPEDERRTLVAVGVTGAGKSTTCNLVTSSRAFDEEEGFDSVTEEAVHYDAHRDGMPIRVIDTVGFFHTQGSADETEAKFGQFSDMTSFGVDVFLLVEKYGRFTESNERHFELFKELAGAEALRHTVLVFTHIQNRQLQQLIDDGQLPPALQSIVGQVAGVVGVENKARPRQAVSDLHRVVSEVIGANAGERYSNKALRLASERREALQARIDALRDADRRHMLSEARKRLNSGSMKYEEVVKAIEAAEAAEADRAAPPAVAKPQQEEPAPCGGCLKDVMGKVTALANPTRAG